MLGVLLIDKIVNKLQTVQKPLNY